MSREDYVKIFEKYPDKVVIAREMINKGYSYALIGEKLNCHGSSVYSFRLREEARGHIFQDKKRNGKVFGK